MGPAPRNEGQSARGPRAAGARAAATRLFDSWQWALPPQSGAPARRGLTRAARRRVGANARTQTRRMHDIHLSIIDVHMLFEHHHASAAVSHPSSAPTRWRRRPALQSLPRTARTRASGLWRCRPPRSCPQGTGCRRPRRSPGGRLGMFRGWGRHVLCCRARRAICSQGCSQQRAARRAARAGPHPCSWLCSWRAPPASWNCPGTARSRASRCCLIRQMSKCQPRTRRSRRRQSPGSRTRTGSSQSRPRPRRRSRAGRPCRAAWALLRCRPGRSCQRGRWRSRRRRGLLRSRGRRLRVVLGADWDNLGVAARCVPSALRSACSV